MSNHERVKHDINGLPLRDTDGLAILSDPNPNSAFHPLSTRGLVLREAIRARRQEEAELDAVWAAEDAARVHEDVLAGSLEAVRD